MIGSGNINTVTHAALKSYDQSNIDQMHSLSWSTAPIMKPKKQDPLSSEVTIPTRQSQPTLRKPVSVGLVTDKPLPLAPRKNISVASEIIRKPPVHVRSTSTTLKQSTIDLVIFHLIRKTSTLLTQSKVKNMQEHSAKLQIHRYFHQDLVRFFQYRNGLQAYLDTRDFSNTLSVYFTHSEIQALLLSPALIQQSIAKLQGGSEMDNVDEHPLRILLTFLRDVEFLQKISGGR